MGCGGDSSLKVRTKEIERQLRKDFAEFKRELKLLLLGTGESGKSTVIKQMRIIYGQGFSEKDLAEFTPLVYRNILRSSKMMLDAGEALGVPLADQALQNQSYQLLDISEDTYTQIAPHVAIFKQLWADAGIREIYNRRNEYQLSDSTAYFFENLDRIAAPSYCPNAQDLLRAREPTTGIHEYVFILDKAVFRMLDVGGQRSERRKWIHCFENITSIIFVAAVSEFNQVLAENHDVNRMTESLSLFEQIINYYWFRETSFILFLNKQDILEEKVKVHNIATYFPTFSGDPHDAETVKNFVKDLYLERKPKDHDIYPHFTMATDTDQIKHVFDAVKSTILRIHLKDYNLF